MTNTKESKRVFYLTEDVAASSLREIIVSIREILAEDKKKFETLKVYKPEPIQLFIDSYGGSVYDGLALANLLNESEAEIHTYCYGKAMSMGFYLFLCGTKRFLHEDATLMYHQISGWSAGKIGDIVIATEQKIELHKLLTKRIIGKLNKKGKKKIENSNKEKYDWFIRGDQALKYGAATDIISYK